MNMLTRDVDIDTQIYIYLDGNTCSLVNTSMADPKFRDPPAIQQYPAPIVVGVRKEPQE
jgi:hypothetical protein